MPVINRIASFHKDMTAWRHDIHSHPETAFEEVRTADIVAAKLKQFGLEVHRGLAKTGVVGVLRSGTSRRAIGLRADMDALDVHETNSFDHKSTIPGKMHACGHDGHTVMLLGAAKYLAETKNFDGTVYFIFQPAEENEGGGRVMVEEGLFERFPVEAVFGMHNWPGMPVGKFGVAYGPAMASSNEFQIRVDGRGAHAALPHLGVDPVFVAVQIAQGLQGIVTRAKKPIDAAVLSITQIHGGDALNVIPEYANLSGTVRTFSDEVTSLIEERMQRIAQLTAEAHGATATVKFVWNYPPTVNHAREADFAATVMDEIVGSSNVVRELEPTMGAEDFAFMLKAKPGAYVFIGNGDGSHRHAGHGAGPCTLHNASYDFNDELIPIGATFWVRLAEQFLR